MKFLVRLSLWQAYSSKIQILRKNVKITNFKTANEFYFYTLYFLKLLTHQFNVCANCNYLQCATTSQVRHEFIRNVNCKIRVNSSWGPTQLSNAVIQFSLRSCYDWRHIGPVSSQQSHCAVACEFFFEKTSLHCRFKHCPKIAQRIFTNFYKCLKILNVLKFTNFNGFCGLFVGFAFICRPTVLFA